MITIIALDSMEVAFVFALEIYYSCFLLALEIHDRHNLMYKYDVFCLLTLELLV
jgi:hypothetical protein